MGHANVWNSHPKNYGPGSRTWNLVLLFSSSCYPKNFSSSWGSMRIYEFNFEAVCVEIPMVLSGSTGLCAADSASVAMPRKSDSSSTAEEDSVFHKSRWVWNKNDLARFFMFEVKY
ncbi:hypothetical protein SADUNF_Sadunf16G0178300 [Salix dunnii]|uniref:Uncharacterized protein n=1 Tax=Salix dunnii TaxID=1413687 RepID=A0A835JCA5_9ROSI|nr:hypothetical protein SADUNF_Sadunf16G0178300 [Salix dunnii]